MHDRRDTFARAATMLMGHALRKLVLTLHIAVSVGWIGAVVAYIPLDVAVATSHDEQTLRAAYIGMDLATTWAIVPLAWAALGTGLLISLGTKWGLFRHYWVVISLILTALAVWVLQAEARVIRSYATLASDASISASAIQSLGSTLPHSIGGLVILLIVMVLNIYKPRGMTRFGWRKHQARASTEPPASMGDGPGAEG